MTPAKAMLGSSDTFWQLIDQRRKQATVSRKELEARLDNAE